jgi:hypothetical protein
MNKTLVQVIFQQTGNPGKLGAAINFNPLLNCCLKLGCVMHQCSSLTGRILMQRRDVLRMLTSSAVLSAMPLEGILLLQQARAEVALAAFPSVGLRTLNPHQNETVITIAELIIPATDTPGATGAKVNEFIDLLLTDWYDKPEADHFLQGLNAIDTTSQKLFNAEFVKCTPAQQTRMLKQMDDEAIVMTQKQRRDDRTKNTATRTTSSSSTASTTVAPTSLSSMDTGAHTTNFFYTFKKLTLFGYYTSEIGFEKELGRSIIPPKHEGCAPLSEAHK